jgi:excisionase family DNA binding protein
MIETDTAHPLQRSAERTPANRRARAERPGREARAAPLTPADRLLDVAEAARLLSIQPRTLYQWAYQRRVPVVKLGRALRFRESDVQRLIRDGYRPALRSPLDGK